MEKILRARAEELAARGQKHDTADNLTTLLVARWEHETWAFELDLFEQLVGIEATLCPQGVTYKGLPCRGFLKVDSNPLPVIWWSDLVGLSPEPSSIYAVSPGLGLALKVPLNCSVEKVDVSDAKPSRRTFCGGVIDGVLLAELVMSR